MNNIHTTFEDTSTQRFLNEWVDNNEYITAHTSGSTGIPKAIKLLKKDMVRSAESTCQFFGINEKSILACPLSADYIAGKMMIVRALVSECELFMFKPSNTPTLGSLQYIDLLPIVPSQIDATLNLTTQTHLNNIIIGGAPVSPAQESKLRTAECNAFATYGMTETCSHVALRNISKNADCYEALPGYTFDCDQRSCLVINHPHTSYKTLITNDIVELITDQKFIWKGRYDNVINTGGLKVHPEEMERKLAPYISRPFYISGIPDDKWGQHVCLTIEGTQTQPVEELMNQFKSVLKNHELPKEVRFTDKFKRTSNGKIIRI